MKKIWFVFWLIIYYEVNAQFHPVAYDFNGAAQVFQSNPGTVYAYKWTIGVPVLTHTSIFAGNTGFSPSDLFATNNSFEQKVFTTLKHLKNTDHLSVNYRQDLFFAAFKSQNTTHFFGIYSEFDHINYYPADLLRLAFEGNSIYQNKKFDLHQLATKTEWFQTLYYGINRSLSTQVQLGAAFKIYSGIANAQSINNSGSFYTSEGVNNYYTHHLNNIDLQAQSSGFKEGGDFNYYRKKMFFTGNYGLGFDLGMTYQKSQKTIWTISLLDLGFIRYNKDIHNYKVQGSYQYEGARIEFPEDNFIDYWKDIKEDFNNKIQKGENNVAYTSIRPAKLYTSVKFGLNSNRKDDCASFLDPDTEYNTYFGVIGFAQYRPLQIHWGTSVFLEKKWSKYFYSRFNVTADNFAYTSLGAGLIANLGPVQFSLTADNLIGLSNLARSQKQSIQFGINIVGFKQ